MEFYCDFDGTITKYDLLDRIIDTKIGEPYRKYMDEKIIEGLVDHDQYVKSVFERVNMSFEDAIKILGDPVEPSFKTFYETCISKGHKFYIISSGFRKFIEHFLPYIPSETIFANDIVVKDDSWEPNFKTKSKVDIINSLHDGKSKKIYFGDGISDFKVINDVDTLYVKSGSYLETHCKTIGHTYTSFDDFSKIKIDIL